MYPEQEGKQRPYAHGTVFVQVVILELNDSIAITFLIGLFSFDLQPTTSVYKRLLPCPEYCLHMYISPFQMTWALPGW